MICKQIFPGFNAIEVKWRDDKDLNADFTKFFLMPIPLFFALFFLLLFAIHYLFCSRVVRKLLIIPVVQKRLMLLVCANFFFNILYVFARYTTFTGNTFYYLFSLSIGITFVLFLYLIVHEVIEVFHKSLKNIDLSKRKFIKKGGDGVLLGLSTAYIAAGAYEGGKEPVVNRIHTNLFDFSIVQISDLHIGGLIDMKFVREAVEKINSLDADIVAITGDLIDTDIHSIRKAVLELTHIRAKHGIYMILGNHEYFHNPKEIIDFIRKETPFTLLLNDTVVLDSLKVNIVGVTDLFGYRAKLLEPDFPKAFEEIQADYPTILLTHQPKSIEELGRYQPELILSGHTHGGQIWPFNHLVSLQQPYVKGLHTLPYGGKIYINSGIGFWGPPMRLGSQAEIAYFMPKTI